MSTVAEDRVLLFRVTDLAQICLFIGHFPVADTFAVPLAIFVTTDVLVAGILLDICTLTVAYVVDPVTFVGVTSWVLHLPAAMAPAKDKFTFVNSACCGQVLALTVVVALEEVTTVEVIGESGFDRLVTSESLDGVVSGLGPEVLNQTIGTGKQAGNTEFRASVPR